MESLVGTDSSSLYRETLTSIIELDVMMSKKVDVLKVPVIGAFDVRNLPSWARTDYIAWPMSNGREQKQWVNPDLDSNRHVRRGKRNRSKLKCRFCCIECLHEQWELGLEGTYES
jgi:hypothetical protein